MCLATTSWARMEFTEQEIKCQEKQSQAGRRPAWGLLPAELAAGEGAIRGFLGFASCGVAERLIEKRFSAHNVPEGQTSQDVAQSI